MLAAAILGVALLTFGAGILVPGLRGRRASRLAGAGLMLAGVALVALRQTGPTWLMAYGEEAAFWLFAPGLGLLAVGFTTPRRRLTPT